MTQARSLLEVVPARPASDGAGVKLKRVMGSGQHKLMDPFLMLDEIRADGSGDLGAGFPAHPHRGIETVSYMKLGGFRHEDHLGNQRSIKSGGVQWMKSGKGIVHSEMPILENDELHGFQIWLNMPAARKMSDPEYLDISENDLPVLSCEGWSARLLLGEVEIDGRQLSAPLKREVTDALLLDVSLEEDGIAKLPLSDKKLMVYVYEGELKLQTDSDQLISQSELAVFAEGDELVLSAERQTGFLIMAGKPLNEPVVQYGPFVMNSREEVMQAVTEYQRGEFLS
ncbi:pirin family protein [Endozoicomonas sp. 8E]|uniref:pirin family protein n=1 Tax=Endozoicomonas sp. 8E TaxID=3035692 RepID=UPI002939444D|nr:pirin family protein [Endozoicomonas sp. 8E]WOG27169.1 pirin family protein [Endozoicomonas sp. 8E]